jgi:hypothetical protein
MSDGDAHTSGTTRPNSPALNLYLALMALADVCRNGVRAFRDLSEERTTHQGRMAALVDAGASPDVLERQHSTTPEHAAGLLRTVKDARESCEQARKALADGGANGWDESISPNSAGQSRSVELLAKLPALERALRLLEVMPTMPDMLAGGEVETLAALGPWFDSARNELQAIFLEPKVPARPQTGVDSNGSTLPAGAAWDLYWTLGKLAGLCDSVGTTAEITLNGAQPGAKWPEPFFQPAIMGAVVLVTRDAQVQCKRVHRAIADGGARLWDGKASPNSVGQPRSIEVIAKLGPLERAFKMLELTGGTRKDIEAITSLGAWCSGMCDDLRAVWAVHGQSNAPCAADLLASTPASTGTPDPHTPEALYGTPIGDVRERTIRLLTENPYARTIAIEAFERVAAQYRAHEEYVREGLAKLAETATVEERMDESSRLRDAAPADPLARGAFNYGDSLRPDNPADVDLAVFWVVGLADCDSPTPILPEPPESEVDAHTCWYRRFDGRNLEPFDTSKRLATGHPTDAEVHGRIARNAERYLAWFKSRVAERTPAPSPSELAAPSPVRPDVFIVSGDRKEIRAMHVAGFMRENDFKIADALAAMQAAGHEIKKTLFYAIVKTLDEKPEWRKRDPFSAECGNRQNSHVVRSRKNTRGKKG